MEIYGVELELLLGLAVVVGVAALWAMKKYREINADGKITLDEIISTVEEGEAHVDAIVDEVDKIEEALLIAARKCSVCGETGHDKRNCPNEESAPIDPNSVPIDPGLRIEPSEDEVPIDPHLRVD